MTSRATRRECLRSVGLAAAVTGAGCIGLTEERFEDNCSERTTSSGEGATDGNGTWRTYGAGLGNAAVTTARGPGDPSLAWRYATCDPPIEETSPVLADGTLYVAHSQKPGTVALNAATGEEQWAVDVSARAPAPAYDDGTLYVAGEAVRALDAGDGSVVWTESAGDSVLRSGPPVVADGTVYLIRGREPATCYALDTTDGSVRWERDLGESGGARATAVGPDAVYVADGQPRLLALDRVTGAVRWSVEGLGSGVVAPVVANGRVHVATSVEVRAFTHDGETVWESTAAGADGPIAVDERRVYTTASSSVTALAAETGERVWFEGATTTNRAPLGPPAVGEGAVYLGRAGRRVDGEPVGGVVALDNQSGEQRWTVRTRGIPAGEGGPYAGTRQRLAVGEGTVYATTGAGDVVAIADP